MSGVPYFTAYSYPSRRKEVSNLRYCNCRRLLCAPTGRLAFTLIEVLVTIAIIAIVASILLPVLVSAKRAAKATVCISNLRQLAAAFVLYSDSHDGDLPPHPNDEVYLASFEPGQGIYGLPTRSEQPRLLVESLDPYVKERSVWFCPEDPVRGKEVMLFGIRHTYTSYKYRPVPEDWSEDRAWPLVVNVQSLPPERAILGDPGFGPNFPQIPLGEWTYHANDMANWVRPDLSAKKIKLGVVTTRR